MPIQGLYPVLDRINCPYLGSLNIDVGDLCFQQASDEFANSANSTLTITGTQATDAAVYAPAFIGVAKERKTSADTTSRSFQVVPFYMQNFAVPSAAYTVGQFMAPSLNSGNTAMLNTGLIATAVPGSAIGICLQDTGGVSVTSVLCAVVSRVVPPSLSAFAAAARQAAAAQVALAPAAGTASGTGVLADGTGTYSQTIFNNNFATVAQTVNAIRTALINAGIIKGSA